MAEDIETGLRDALERMAAQPSHGPDGRFIPGTLAAATTFEHTEAFWSAVAPVKRELLEQVQRDSGNTDAPATLSGLQDAYCEVRLFRSAMFLRLVEQGGPITSKGKARALYTAYLSALDRETKLATTLGLERKPRPVVSPLDWINGKVDA